LSRILQSLLSKVPIYRHFADKSADADTNSMKIKPAILACEMRNNF
jgi:hypothetical protein